MASFGLLSGRLKKDNARPVAVTRPMKPAPSNADKPETEARTKTIISDDITLYTLKNIEPLYFKYDIISTAPKNLKFVMNFKGSLNFSTVDATGAKDESLQLTTVVAPGGTASLGSVHLGDPYKGARLEVEYDWEFIEFNDDDVRKAVQENNALLESQRKSKDSNLFFDSEFKPSPTTLYSVNETIIDTGEQTSLTPKDEELVWYRPSQFFSGNAQVFEDMIEPGDIIQGALGDCWFLCTLACLGEFEILVKVSIQ